MSVDLGDWTSWACSGCGAIILASEIMYVEGDIALCKGCDDKRRAARVD